VQDGCTALACKGWPDPAGRGRIVLTEQMPGPTSERRGRLDGGAAIAEGCAFRRRGVLREAEVPQEGVEPPAQGLGNLCSIL
jgi:hypothetical protein